MPLRFSANFSDPELNLDPLIDEIFSELKSGFLELPKGQGFVEYSIFETGFQALKKATAGFTKLSVPEITTAVYATPIAFIVLRTILGFTPSEWADVTSERTGVQIDQGAARNLDWPAAGSVDTELRCLMELEVSDAEKEVQPRVQA